MGSMTLKIGVALAIWLVGLPGGFAADKVNTVEGLEDIAWLSGTWRSADIDGQPVNEETWSTPAASAMMGMFRMHTGDRLIVYEFLLIEEDDDGIFMRFHHFGRNLKIHEEKPLRLRLTPGSKDELVFENTVNAEPKSITYTRDGRSLTVAVKTMRDGTETKFTLHFTKQGED